MLCFPDRKRFQNFCFFSAIFCLNRFLQREKNSVKFRKKRVREETIDVLSLFIRFSADSFEYEAVWNFYRQVPDAQGSGSPAGRACAGAGHAQYFVGNRVPVKAQRAGSDCDSLYRRYGY